MKQMDIDAQTETYCTSKINTHLLYSITELSSIEANSKDE